MDRKETVLDILYARDKGICHICKQPVPRNEATKDHKRPRSRGGPNHLSNYGLAHEKCNNKKADTWDWEFGADGSIVRGFIDHGN